VLPKTNKTIGKKKENYTPSHLCQNGFHNENKQQQMLARIETDDPYRLLVEM
jgi:hypothetical protein